MLRTDAEGQQSPDGAASRRTALKAELLQEAIFNSAYFSSIATDEKGVIQLFNVGAERMLGYSTADVLNRFNPADLSDPEELIARAAQLSTELGVTIAPGFEALVFKASRGIEDIYELTYIRKDGTRLPAVVSVTALRDAQEAIIGYLLIGTDNTARQEVEAERLRFERALEVKNIELVHANRMKSEFLATMSHELRTPLNAIMGFSDALLNGLMGEVANDQSEYIHDIYTSGEHLLSLINDILDLSKVEAGMMSLDLEVTDLRALLTNSLSIVKEKAADRAIQLELDIDEGLRAPQLDQRKTKQIVYNMLSNAVKFSPHGGSVTLTARLIPRAQAGAFSGDWPMFGFPLADGDDPDFLEICVADDGIGISPENMPKLFQAFSQIDSSLSRRFEGTGLGLAMVKQLAELHGGSVAVASREHVGTRFAAWLPLRTSPLPEPFYSVPAPTRSAAHPAARLAVVLDDEPREADLVRLMLEAEGFKVVVANTGPEALRLAAEHAPAVITVDIQLPGADGWAFLGEFRAMAALAHTPVVVISAAPRVGERPPGDLARVLQKPVSHAQLNACLDELGLREGPQRTRTVLVVDDDPKAISVMAALLRPPAYSVVRAFGGAEAIALAQRLRPDLILLDLMMPEVSGFDVVAALQSVAETERIPILVVTAKTITAADRTTLADGGGRSLRIIEKAGFNQSLFLTEVHQALASREEAAA